jgi:glycosyltransferase involved in cell wall biosynthesis
MSEALEIPVVTTLHTPPIPWLESAVRFAAPSSRFVAVSDSVAVAWRHAVAATTIRNGVDLASWRPGPGGGPALWSGRIVPEKAPHEALDAAHLAGVPIELAGPVHDVDYFRREVEPRLGERAHYLGHLHGSQLRSVVGRASVAVVTPAWDEPFGLVAAEALACGTPVAAYDRGALGEIVDDSSGVLTPSGDTHALARALRSAARKDRQAVRRRAVELFPQERMVDAYEAVYCGLAGMQGAA